MAPKHPFLIVYDRSRHNLFVRQSNFSKNLQNHDVQWPSSGREQPLSSFVIVHSQYNSDNWKNIISWSIRCSKKWSTTKENIIDFQIMNSWAMHILKSHKLPITCHRRASISAPLRIQFDGKIFGDIKRTVWQVIQSWRMRFTPGPAKTHCVATALMFIILNRFDSIRWYVKIRRKKIRNGYYGEIT